MNAVNSGATTVPQRTEERPWLGKRDRRVLEMLFTIDTRALDVVRILLAGILLYEGIFIEWSRPRSGANGWETFVEYGDMLVVPFALMLLLGYRTRLALLLTWLSYSLPIRAGLFNADVSVDLANYVLNLTLFWCLFLPVGRHLSIDAMRKGSREPVRYLSVASGALLLQIFIIYFSAGITKEMGEWVSQATALETILSNPAYETTLGQWMLQFPAVLSVMSIATIVLEIVGPVLLFIPGKTLERRRIILVPMFIGLHVGMALFMNLGIFPYIMMAIWLIFLPARAWDRLWRATRGRVTRAALEVDANRWRNGLATVAVVIAAVSNVITWLYFPDVEGFADRWQEMSGYLLLYQQWAMFSVPSSLS